MNEVEGKIFCFILFGLILGVFIMFAIFNFFDTRALRKKKKELYSKLKKSRTQVYVSETEKSMSAKSYYCPYCLTKLNPIFFPVKSYPNYFIYVFGGDDTCPNCHNTIYWDNVMNMFDKKVKIVKGVIKE